MKKTFITVLFFLSLINLGHCATRNVVPRANGEGQIGTDLKNWSDAYFDALHCDGTIKASNVIVTTDASSTIVHATERINIGTSNFANISKDASHNLTLFDEVTGVKTLAQLLSYTETDPIYSAWDKSTGISITESQISDLGSYQTLDSDLTSVAGLITAGLVKRTNSTTYSTVTDNSLNWDTAYGWGNHTTQGYITSEDDSLFSVVARGSVAGAGIRASNIIVDTDASSPVIHATSRIDIGSSNFSNIFKDASHNLTFFDEVTGTKTLAQLAAGGSETDPIVGAINGIVKANGAGVISAASEGTDYLAPTRIDDTKGNGDTTYAWSADKTFDQLALKLNTASNNDTLDDLSDNDTDDLAEGSVNKYSTLLNIKSALSNDFHNVGGTEIESDSLFSVVSRGSIAGGPISASDVIVQSNASSPVVHATSRLDIGSSPFGNLWLDTSNNLTLSDTVTGARTLAQLAAGGVETDPVVKALTGIIKSNGSVISAITDNSSNWDTAYTDRLKWDGGSTGLTPATGRTSLELGTAAQSATTDFLAAGGTAVNSSLLENHNSAYFQIAGNYLTSESDSLFSVVSRGSIAGGNISASDVIVQSNASSPVVHATSRIDIGATPFGNIWLDGSNNLTLSDSVTGSKTLAQLVAGGTITIADITDASANGRSLISAADYAAMRGLLDLEAGTDFNAYDADLTTWAGITPGANVGTFLATPSSANLLAAITDETGTGTAVFNNSPTFEDDIQLGKAGATGILKLYSEQGATDYTASLYPNTAMTSAASFYLPADEPAATSFVNMTTGGVMGFIAPNAGTDITADLEEEAHAAEHAVSAADTVFPADPGADRYLMWDDDPGALVWAAGGGGYTNLTQFVDQNTWKVFYSNTSGDVTELALGASGTYLMSNGASSAPTFETPAGSGDITSVGDVVSGAAFDGTQGTTLTFYNAGGNATLDYDGTDFDLTKSLNLALDQSLGFKFYELTKTLSYNSTSHDFVFNDDVDIHDTSPHLNFRDTTANTAFEFHYDNEDGSYPGLALFHGTDTGTGFVVDADGRPSIHIDATTKDVYFRRADVHILNTLQVGSLASTSVSITGDGDGAVTFKGLGNGADEDLTLNLDDTANTAVWSSSTGMDKWDLSAFDIAFKALSIEAGAYGAATIDGDDVNSNIAGRSLTLTAASPDTLDADPELYTDFKGMTIETPTDADNFFAFEAPFALTVTRVQGIVENATSAVLTWQECDAAGDNCSTIESITADVDGTISTSIDNASIDAGDIIRLDVGTVTGTVGQAHSTVTFTKND